MSHDRMSEALHIARRRIKELEADVERLRNDWANLYEESLELYGEIRVRKGERDEALALLAEARALRRCWIENGICGGDACDQLGLILKEGD